MTLIERLCTFTAFWVLHVVEEHDDGVTVELPMSPDLSNSYGQVHGGVTATLVDAAFGLAVQKRYGEQRATATIEMSVSYLRPASRGVLRARSRFIKTGRTLLRGQVDVYDDEERHLAVGLATYMLL